MKLPRPGIYTEVTLAVIGAAALLVIVAVLVSTALGASTATGRINVTATLTHISSRNARPPGRQSNASEQAWRITSSHGKTLGRMLLQCRWILERARLCTGEIEMPTGKITVAGSSPTSFQGEYAVTGGTGFYRGGGGVMLWEAIGLRKSVLLITITT